MSPTALRLAAADLSIQMRELLIEHVDKPAVELNVIDGNRRRVILALVQRGLLRYCTPDGDCLRPGLGGVVARPMATQISPDGREVLCALLAEYADAIVRAGFAVDHLLSGINAPANRQQSEAVTA